MTDDEFQSLKQIISALKRVGEATMRFPEEDAALASGDLAMEGCFFEDGVGGMTLEAFGFEDLLKREIDKFTKIQRTPREMRR